MWGAIACLGLGGLVAAGVIGVIYCIQEEQKRQHKYQVNRPVYTYERFDTIDDIKPPHMEVIRRRSVCQKSKDEQMSAEKQNQCNENRIYRLQNPSLRGGPDNGRVPCELQNRQKFSSVGPKICKSPTACKHLDRTAYERKIACLQRRIEVLEKSEGKRIEVKNQVNKILSSSDKVEEWLEGRQETPASRNDMYNDDASSVDVSVDSVGTVYSFGSTISKIGKYPQKEEILTWLEMSDKAKQIAKCPGCGNGVETVTVPCEHPYMCLECLFELFPQHPYCTWCDKKLTCYKGLSYDIYYDTVGPVYSFDSTILKIAENSNKEEEIPTWYEMSDQSKQTTKCSGCERGVDTVTVPCGHPYMCLECATLELFPHHPYCSWCDEKLTDYQGLSYSSYFRKIK